MKHSEAINELAAALAKARLKIENPTFDRENPHFRAKYATLAACLHATSGPLSENGLVLMQEPIVDADGAGVDWMLAHSSGQWVSGRLVLPLEKRTPQGVGSATTYARRYTLAAVLGIAGEEDDDGNAAEPPPPPPPAKRQATKPTETKPARPEYLKPLDEILAAAGSASPADAEAIVAFVTKRTATWVSVKSDPLQAKALLEPLKDAYARHGAGLLDQARVFVGDTKAAPF